MLSEIYIENIAVIEKVSVNFNNGFNVFTGETGAGKSIIIDAINAVLGQRTSKELIRSGAQKAVVSAVFSNFNSHSLQLLSEMGYEPDEDGVIILYREMYASGKNLCRINGVPANVSALREISKILITIHGQHESYELLTPDLHMQYLDFFGKLENDISEYKKEFIKYRDLKTKLNSGKESESERLKKLDMLRYQIDELEQAELEIGEDEQLLSRRKMLQGSETIRQCISSACALLSGDEDYDGAVSAIKNACDEINEASEYQEDLSVIASRLNDVYYEIEDISDELSRNDDFSYDTQQELEEVEERLDLIYKLQRKYGPSIEAILESLEQAKSEFEYLDSYEYNMEKLLSQYKEQKKLCESLAKNISEKRIQSSERFSEEVESQLAFLDMPNVKLYFDIQHTELCETGCDKVEMMISPNVGEEAKSISKIASGGELSRIMLAIKNVLAEGDHTGTLIFDEIDTGISGSAAHKVGLKLKETSRTKQIICITHQTQLASLANTHFLIKKEVRNDRSFTEVNELDFSQRVKELARIMSGTDVSSLTLQHAEEMLKKGLEA
ncbi:MAG: DNA repair protein RecN [Clostridia bacterium]|nr:DNA repair protein RecN [Clostridia bacterium]